MLVVARVEGKELDKKDYDALAKILGIPEKELRKLVMKPQALTFRQAVKLAHILGLSVLFTTQGFIKWY